MRPGFYAGARMAAILAGASVLGGALYQAVETARDKRRYPPPGGRVRVGEHFLHLISEGEGRPTVVLDAGLGQGSLVWGAVQPEVAKFARVVAYDRAGYAWSDPGPAPRSAGVLAGELRELLGNAGLPGPYVLVAHSMSGLTARRFAASYPEETAGMVLLDTVHESLWSREPLLFDRYFGALARRFRYLAPVVRLGLLRLAARLGFAEVILPGFVTEQPANVRSALLTGYLSGKNFAAAVREAEALKPGVGQARDVPAGDVDRDLPLVVLSHSSPSMFSGLAAEEAQTAERAWQSAQATLAASSARGRLAVAEGSGHDVHIERPDLVVEAIRRLAEQSGT